jgi:hypothetical protein
MTLKKKIMMNEKLNEESDKIYDESEDKVIIAILIYFFCGYIFILSFIFILLLIYNYISSLLQFILILIVSLVISLGLIYYSAKKENYDE